jgi:myo-inositol-1(or 4)-monophosphatase
MAMAFLARGMVDCIQVDHLEAWDSLAGTVIIHEAGGMVMDTKGTLICMMY